MPTTNLLESRPRALALKRRVLERVADADETHLSITARAGQWQPFGSGVWIKVLREQEGTLSYLLRLEPGASLPAHRHPQDEECVVLEGELSVGTRHTLGPGSYHVAHRGALHAPLHTRDGALLFLRGAVPDIAHVLA